MIFASVASPIMIHCALNDFVNSIWDAEITHNDALRAVSSVVVSTQSMLWLFRTYMSRVPVEAANSNHINVREVSANRPKSF